MPSLIERGASRRPIKTINGPNGEPYLRRYFLFHVFGVTAYLHHFVDSDPDRGLHDHPWRWSYSLVLVGGYLEQRFDGFHLRKPGRIHSIRGTTFHRVILEARRDAWTLFIHGERYKKWGFLRRQNGKLVYEPQPSSGGDWWKNVTRVHQ